MSNPLAQWETDDDDDESEDWDYGTSRCEGKQGCDAACETCAAIEAQDGFLVDWLHEEQWREMSITCRWYRQHPGLVASAARVGLRACTRHAREEAGKLEDASTGDPRPGLDKSRSLVRRLVGLLADLVEDGQRLGLTESDVGNALALESLVTDTSRASTSASASTETPHLLQTLVQSASESEQLRFIEQRHLIEAACGSADRVARLLVDRPRLTAVARAHELLTVQACRQLALQRADTWFAAFLAAHTYPDQIKPGFRRACQQWQEDWGWTLSLHPLKSHSCLPGQTEPWRLNLLSREHALALLDAIRVKCPCVHLLVDSNRVEWKTINGVAPEDGYSMLDRAFDSLERQRLFEAPRPDQDFFYVVCWDLLPTTTEASLLEPLSEVQSRTVAYWLLKKGARRLTRMPLTHRQSHILLQEIEDAGAELEVFVRPDKIDCEPWPTVLLDLVHEYGRVVRFDAETVQTTFGVEVGQPVGSVAAPSVDEDNDKTRREEEERGIAMNDAAL